MHKKKCKCERPGAIDKAQQLEIFSQFQTKKVASKSSVDKNQPFDIEHLPSNASSSNFILLRLGKFMKSQALSIVSESDKIIMQSARTRTFATNSLFGAIFLAAYGLALLQTWAVELRIGGLTHAMIAIPGLGVTAILLYRYSRHWPARQAQLTDQKAGARPRFEYRSTLSPLLLISIGGGMAAVTGVGSYFFIVLAASALIIVPWTKIAICRDHFFLSLALICAGAMGGIALSGNPPHPLHYPLSACALLFISGFMALFIVLIHGNQSDCLPVSGY